MKQMMNGIEVEYPDVMSKDEVMAYVKYVHDHTLDRRLIRVAISIREDGQIALDWEGERKFERIRRITGYLVGTVDRWNDGKRAELADRVKHGLAGAHI